MLRSTIDCCIVVDELPVRPWGTWRRMTRAEAYTFAPRTFAPRTYHRKRNGNLSYATKPSRPTRYRIAQQRGVIAVFRDGRVWRISYEGHTLLTTVYRSAGGAQGWARSWFRLVRDRYNQECWDHRRGSTRYTTRGAWLGTKPPY